MFALTVLAVAQETQRVAILEVVDKENKLSYSQKLVLRSNMARAVANTPGYEAYDRSDVDAIMSEQDFQRTGMVSDDEIRKLGEMTGVSLILVTEGVLMGNDKLFISAKILNVETARVEIMDNVTTSLNDIQAGCNALASRLFGTNAVSSASSRYAIASLGGGNYSYQNKTLNEKAYMNFLQNNCPEAYAQHLKGKRMMDGGWAALAIGLAMTGVGAGLICVANNNAQTYNEQIAAEQAKIDKTKNKLLAKYGSTQEGWSWLVEYRGGYNDVKEGINTVNEYEARIKVLKQQCDSDPDVGPYKSSGTALAVVGPFVVAGSVPLLYFGFKAKRKSVDVYNGKCVSSSAKTLSLNLTSGSSGLGLAMQF